MLEKKYTSNYVEVNSDIKLNMKLLYNKKKGDKFKEYYELSVNQGKLSELISTEKFNGILYEVKNILNKSELDSFEILIIGPGQGRIEIPLMKAIFKTIYNEREINSIRINIHIVEPVTELLNEFTSYLDALRKELYLLDKTNISISHSSDRLEDFDVGNRKFHLISVFFVLQYVEAQFAAIKKLDELLEENGLILWGEENGWLKAIDGIFSSTDHRINIPTEWENFWKDFHAARYRMGKPYTNPIKASDHSLTELFFRDYGYIDIFSEIAIINLEKGIEIRDIYEWFKIEMWMPLFFALNNNDCDKIYSEIEKKLSNFHGPRKDAIKLVGMKKIPRIFPYNVKSTESISRYFRKTNLLVNMFKFEEDISSNELIKQLDYQNKFHSNQYEHNIINRRLFVLSHFLFRLLNKNIHIDYVLWQPNYENFCTGTYLSEMPFVLLHSKDQIYTELYLGWYIFYFLTRKCLGVEKVLSDFLFKEIPFFQEFNILKLKEIDTQTRLITLKEDILEIKFPGMCEAFFNELSKSYGNLIIQFGKEFHCSSCSPIYNFDKLLEPIKNFIKKYPNEFKKLSDSINDQYNIWFNIYGEKVKKELKEVLISPILLQISENYFESILKNIFSLNFINRGNWESVNFKLNYIFKKEGKYEGYQLITSVGAKNLNDDEKKIMDSVILEVSSLFSAKDTLYMTYRLIKREVFRNSVKSAISAIMSRNMSHNIGSHVIADMVSKGINTEEGDLNSFFRYIQNRMDFIAQITTEFPEWTYPAYFNKEIMRIFYENYLLIDRIGGSESLEAFKWDQDWKKGYMRGKIIIRTGIKFNSNFKWVINEYKMGNLEDDLQLAIPGGIVGYHAFYIIIENMIRNSAKHDYAVRVPKMLDDRKQILIIKNISTELTSMDKNLKIIDLTSDELKDTHFLNRFKAVVIESSCFKVGTNIENRNIGLNNNLNYSIEELHRIYIACHDENCNGCAFESNKCWEQNTLSYHLLSNIEWKVLTKKIEYDVVLKYLLHLPLRINIRIDDIPNKNYVWVTLWDDMPQYANYDFNIEESIFDDFRHEISGYVEEDSIKNRITEINLFGHLNDFLRQAFIKDTGELKRENWGLAELKICAGYLQNRYPEEIGGSNGSIIDYGNDCFSLSPLYIIDDENNPNKGYPKMIIKAIPVDKYGEEKKKLKKNKSDSDHIYFLGYRFWMKKPKIMALIGESPSKGVL